MSLIEDLRLVSPETCSEMGRLATHPECEDKSFLYPAKRVSRYQLTDDDDKNDSKEHYGSYIVLLVFSLFVVVWISCKIYTNPCLYIHNGLHLVVWAVLYLFVIASWTHLAYLIGCQAIDDLKQYLTGERTPFKRLNW